MPIRKRAIIKATVIKPRIPIILVLLIVLLLRCIFKVGHLYQKMKVLASDLSYLFVSAYILSYNNNVVKKEGVLMLKKYFSKYKWTDLFWILFVILTCIYIGNRDLLPLNHQEFSLRGSFWGFVLALYQLLFIDKFIISNRK